MDSTRKGIKVNVCYDGKDEPGRYMVWFANSEKEFFAEEQVISYMKTLARTGVAISQESIEVFVLFSNPREFENIDNARSQAEKIKSGLIARFQS